MNLARFAGYKFMGMDSSSNTMVKIEGQESVVQMKQLHVLEFNSTRYKVSINTSTYVLTERECLSFLKEKMERSSFTAKELTM